MMSGGIPLNARVEFHTWREAVLQAFDYADLFTTASKPRVRRVDDCWVLTYTYRPIAMNAVWS
jgi:hypothetical protein